MLQKLIIYLVILLVTGPFIFAQSGTLVPSFGDNGIKQIDFGQTGSSDDYGEIIKTDAEGKIWIAGESLNQFSIFRLNTDGSIDSTFGSDGKYLFPAGTYGDRVYGLAFSANDKMLLIARSYYNISILKFKPDGTLDSSFNGNGKVILPRESNYDDTWDGLGFVVDQGGKILIAYSTVNDNQNAIRVIRLNADGSLDNTFASDGKLLVSIGTFSSTVCAMAIDHNNKILVAGKSLFVIEGQVFDTIGYRMSVIRFDTEGILDSTFNGDGKLVVNIGDVSANLLDKPKSLVIDNSGKILIAGIADYNSNSAIDESKFAILRLNDDGSFDNTFNGDGIALISVGDHIFDITHSLSLDSFGKIVVAGTSSTISSDRDFSAIRLKTDGTLDSSFNGTGKIIIPLGDGNDEARSFTFDEDGKILIAGFSYNGKNNNFSVARVNADGSLDNTFSSYGKLLIPSDGIDEAKSLIIDPAGKVLAAGTSFNGNDNDFSIVRLNADGSFDRTFNETGKLMIPVGNDEDFGNCLAQDVNGKILIAGTSIINYQREFSIIRLNSNGSLDSTFDADGKLVIPIWASSNDGGNLTIDAFGKIIIVGGTAGNFCIFRLNSDGSMDSTFNGDGIKIIDDSLSGYANCVALDADGKILMAGRSVACSGHECGWENFQIIRLNRDGSYDSTFDGDGKLILRFPDPQLIYYINNATSIKTDHKGKILIAGSTSRQDNVWDNSHWGPGITRLNSDGSLDTTFKANGKHLFPVIVEYANKYNMSDIHANLPDSKILITGSFDGDYSVLRLTYDGILDSTFGNSGIIKPIYGQGNAMKADSNYIWMAGSANGDFKIIKLYARNNQHIDFSIPDTVQYGDPLIKLGGTASSGLPVAYSSSNPAVASVTHDTLAITGTGTVTITARQAGDGSYYSADPVSKNMLVISNISTISKYELDKEIITFPNPVSTILFLESKTKIKSIVLTGVSGNILYKNTHINDIKFEIDMSEYKAGCYILTILLNDDNPPLVRKVLKF
jgi:uncharacterized delta-60 repeat protein